MLPGNVKEKKNQPESWHISLSDQSDEHVSMNINTFRIYKGVWGAGPPRSRRNLKKKSNKMEAFPYYFFCFLARLPISPKLRSCSLAPLK